MSVARKRKLHEHFVQQADSFVLFRFSILQRMDAFIHMQCISFDPQRS